ncbi:MAG TPA: D-isomer specific 2-hydroxyacid dehydrogenase family protein [Egicoccus sp.]|nr:D-isomer specific 2-hydroxyacid dehydrogenase family protein [Egicoccus sp.]HSK25219.1 D-isomer specific 2-hydroxyacid dehydrogenase family protein [Egicoccus sp.]
MARPKIAVLPDSSPQVLRDAVEAGGGTVVGIADADALIWADPKDPGGLRGALDANPQVRWVQLPYAGIEPFVDALDHDRTWTCGKGVYAEPVAEHALALALGGMRGIGRYARETAWSEPYGVNLLGGRVTILGGGEITRSLVRLLRPFGAHLTVVRRNPEPIDGVAEVMGSDRLHDALRGADLVVLALALTPETAGIIDAAALDAMPEHAWLVNVARGGHIVTEDLVAALREGRIGGAALDVTDPEPLPEGHALWDLPNAIITPHTANTPEMGRVLLAARVRENVQRFGDGAELIGPVDVDLGY